ncbi:hypothetical protein AGMMS50229_03440 [Campylobacterota bacterium]|nr:hypothetical protein AGMMS50229_03440 [Campylobacterota bacterium]
MKKLLIALCVVCVTSLYAASIAELEKGCKNGNAANCTNLGLAYANGDGVPQDYVKAAEFSKKACDQGEAAGCSNLGVLYAKGNGVQQDYAKSNELYKKSCDKGYALGCSNLGVAYYEGNGVKQNNTKALELVTKGCDLGENVGCDNRVIALRRLPSDTNPSPIGLQLGKSTIADVKQKYRLITKKGREFNAINGGEMYDIDTKNISIEGVKSGVVIFEQDGTLAFVYLNINKNRFDAMFDQLSGKYKLTHKEIPAVGNKLAKFKVGNSEIELYAPHLGFELDLTYATDAFWQASKNYSRKKQEQKKQSEASQL